ncbi:MAG: hypothetical protein ACREKL_05925 [Chthoniobacterales bacterium]
MFRRLGTTLVCLAMFSIAGGHWGMLQTVAWAGMLKDYARADGLVVAAEKTFSGNYPCALCKRIADKKSSEQKQAPLVKSGNKFDKLVAQHAAATLFPPTPDYFLSMPPALPLKALSYEPPQPVPRTA